MLVKLVETFVNISALPLVPIVKGNLLAVGKETSVQGAIVTFEGLLLCNQLAEGWRNSFDDVARNTVPGKYQTRTFPADEGGQFATKKHNVENRLCSIKIQV
jgi:hypothetical protein